MKKIIQMLTIVLVATAGFGGLASAESCDNISITGTGPNSTNSIDCTDVTDIAYTCTNNVLTLNYTHQDGTTGSATVDFNTHTGAAVTGSVTNDNNQTTDLSTACGPTAAPVSSPTPPATPGGGGGAGGALPKTLPYTADSFVINTVLAGLGIATTLAVLSRLAVAAIRRIVVR